jgi:hypothetical protein
MGSQIHQRDKDREESQHVHDENDTFNHRQEPANNCVDEDCDSENTPAEESTMPPLRFVAGVV